METLGMRLRRMREDSGKTHNEIARALNSLPVEFSCYEKDQIIPDPCRLLTIMRFLGVQDSAITDVQQLRNRMFKKDPSTRAAIGSHWAVLRNGV